MLAVDFKFYCFPPNMMHLYKTMELVLALDLWVILSLGRGRWEVFVLWCQRLNLGPCASWANAVL